MSRLEALVTNGLSGLHYVLALGIAGALALFAIFTAYSALVLPKWLRGARFSESLRHVPALRIMLLSLQSTAFLGVLLVASGLALRVTGRPEPDGKGSVFLWQSALSLHEILAAGTLLLLAGALVLISPRLRDRLAYSKRFWLLALGATAATALTVYHSLRVF